MVTLLWELQKTNRKITKIIYITLAKLLMKAWV